MSDVSVDVSSLTKNNVDSFVNDILKKLGGEQAIIDSIENPKTLFFTGNVNDALINKDDIVKFLKDTVDNYRSSFSPSEDMPQEVIDHNVEVFKQELAKQVKVDYPKRAESQILSQVIQKLMATGI